MFSELDKLLLPWLPYIISMLLGIWLITEAGEATEEAEENLQWDNIEEDRSTVEQPQQPLETPKPLLVEKATKKSAVAALIASEYQKNS